MVNGPDNTDNRRIVERLEFSAGGVQFNESLDRPAIVFLSAAASTQEGVQAF
jgi:hypothetical protein